MAPLSASAALSTAHLTRVVYTLADIEKRKADRLKVMAAIYAETGANAEKFVKLWPIRDVLGFEDEYMGSIVSYLKGEGLVNPLRTMAGAMTPLQAKITHRGVKEMERSEESPKEPTEHFPPRSEVNITINGDMIGSAIQSNSDGATQNVTTGDIAIGTDTKDQIGAFIAEYDAKLAALANEQTAESLAVIAADVATVKAQVASPKGKKHFIKESVASIRSVLENGVGGAVTTGLLFLLGQIHF